jgi:ACS family 4-hydroxyphenylacetate permease-like MFS transporter
MTTISVADGASVRTEQTAAIRRVWLRLIPFLFVLYTFNYLDRINIGFAAFSMNKDLALTATTFGLANSIFYPIRSSTSAVSPARSPATC